MSTKEMIAALRMQGHRVTARQRTDGGWLITKIDNKTFKGAKGNQRARDLLGVSYSKKKLEQARYNVSQYIRGKRKQRTLDDKIKLELRKVQRIWRKNKVQGRITALNVKRHIREFGKEEALKYLQRQTRYGRGYAYEKNVEYLAQYLEDVAMSVDDEVKNSVLNCAMIIRGMTDTFKEEWISMIYSLFYEVRNSGFDTSVTREAIRRTYEIMKG